MSFLTNLTNSNLIKLSLIGILMTPFVQKLSASDENIIQEGSTVSFHYTLVVEKKVVDSSIDKMPMSYVQGSHRIVKGLEENMLGLKKGDKKHITVKPNKGYGFIDSQAFQIVPINTFKDSKNLKVGQILTGQYDGSSINARIIEVGKKNVTLDMNHPLAGKTLEFDIEVVDIKN